MILKKATEHEIKTAQNLTEEWFRENKRMKGDDYAAKFAVTEFILNGRGLTMMTDEKS